MDRNQLLNDQETAIRYAMSALQSNLWTSFPAIVQSVDLTAMTLTAQPVIQGIVNTSDDSTSYTNISLLTDVPIVFPSGGGFALTFPIAVNDEVLIVVASRCIDSWWQNGGIGIPMETRMHDLSDGFAIVGPYSQPNVLSSVSPSNVQLRNKAGTVIFEITSSGKFGMQNSTKDLSGVLDGMLDLLSSLETALTTFASAAAGDPIAVVTAAAATALAASLATLAPQITAYKTTDIGALLE